MTTKLKITTFPDGSQKAECVNPYKTFKSAKKVLEKHGFIKNMSFGNVCRFDGTYGTAYIIFGGSHLPYSRPYTITIYSKEK